MLRINKDNGHIQINANIFALLWLFFVDGLIDQMKESVDGGKDENVNDCKCPQFMFAYIRKFYVCLISPKAAAMNA